MEGGGGDGEDGADGEVGEGAGSGEGGDALLEGGRGLEPVVVHEEHRLCRALLPAEGVRILIGLPRHVREVGLLGRNIRAQDLPVEAGILDLNLALQSPKAACSTNAKEAPEGGSVRGREGRMGGREGRVRVRETRCDGDMVSVR